MSPYILHCTVCEHDFTTRSKWLRHFLKSEHQKKTRDQFFEWDDKLRECVLVVFSSFPVAKCDAILQHFSSNRWKEDEGFVDHDKLVIVTDFVWFPERPCVGFLQFESRAKVDALMPRSSSLEVRIDNQLVQLKKAADYMQLEWNLLLPMKKEDEACPPDLEKGEHALVTANDRHSAAKPILPDTYSEPEQPSLEHIGNSEINFSSPSLETIYHQYVSIRRDMTVPDHMYKKTHVTAMKLESAFSDRFPNVRAIMFRNRYLGLYTGIKHTGSDEVLLFLLTKSEYSTDGEEVNSLTEDALNIFEDVFSTPKSINLFGGRVLATDKEIPCGYTFISNFPALKFNIIKDTRLLPEAQACRLLKYMMKFDSRLKPLLTLVRFWAKINIVRTSLKTRKCFEPPESSHLDWLFIFFLCNKKILPTPRQIQQIPHEPLLLDGVDIGFSESSPYLAEWRSHNPDAHVNLSTCLSDVLPLLLDFFQFLDAEVLVPVSKKTNKIIINTRDGDIINEKRIFPKKSGSGNMQITRLTKDEVDIVRSHKRMKDGLGYTLYVLHPLYLGCLSELDMGPRLWAQNKMVISQTANQLETAFRKCNVSGEIELIEDFHFRQILWVKFMPIPN